MASQTQKEIIIPTCETQAHSLPSYPHEGSSAAAVYACIDHSVIILPGESKRVPTGLQTSIPFGYEIQVRPLTSLASSYSVTVLNAPGTIDSDYRGNIDIILINHGAEPFTVTSGMKIAEFVLAPIAQPSFVNVNFKISEGAKAPHYATEGAAGADLSAFIAESITLAPLTKAWIPTGVTVSIPKGFEGQLRPRSGLAAKNSVTILNSPATISAENEQEIHILLINFSDKEFTILPGMRIAQLIISLVVRALFISAKEPLQQTERGINGFGHTGLH